MSVKEMVDAMLRMLEILISWPVILLIVILLVRSQLPEVIATLAQRITKGPFGTEFAQLQEKMDTIATRVKQIEEKITYKLPPGSTMLEQRLGSALSFFRAYLKDLGFEPKVRELEVSIKSDYPGRAYYDPSTHQIVIADDLASKEDAYLYQYTYHALRPVSMEDLHTISDTSQEIEAGLALYFVCSFTNYPVFVPKVVQAPPEQRDRWDLSCQKAFERVQPSGYGIHDLSKVPWIETFEGWVWAAAFWQIRTLLDQDWADKLLFATWSDLQPSDFHSNNRVDFAKRLLGKARTNMIKYDDVHQIQAIFERCGLKF
jgi:hypothetical protein